MAPVSNSAGLGVEGEGLSQPAAKNGSQAQDSIVARGPEAPEQSSAEVSSQQVQRLTEMAVQHHEYLCAELRRMREEYEQEFAQERAAMRTLRQRWMERICDDQVRGEDAIRYLVETVRSGTKKSEPPTPSET